MMGITVVLAHETLQKTRKFQSTITDYNFIGLFSRLPFV